MCVLYVYSHVHVDMIERRKFQENQNREPLNVRSGHKMPRVASVPPTIIVTVLVDSRPRVNTTASYMKLNL